MTIFDMQPAAQITVLQGLSTYAALASAYFFARPILRTQTLAANRDLLSGLTSPDAQIDALLCTANDMLADRSRREQRRARRDNSRGVVCLALSFLLFSIAVVRQVQTAPPPRGDRASGLNLSAAARRAPVALAPPARPEPSGDRPAS